jgi:hypothetical protein
MIFWCVGGKLVEEGWVCALLHGLKKDIVWIL